MAGKCKTCSDQIIWATIKNGPLAGKKRPFDYKGNANGGKFQFAIIDSGEVDEKYGNPILEAKFYDDPMEGLERHEVLYFNHFDRCKTEGYSKGGDSSPASGSVMIGGVKYNITLTPAEKPKEDEAF